MFEITDQSIDLNLCRQHLLHVEAGGYVAFEGWVRNHNEGRKVEALEYEIFDSLASKEGARILAEALERFSIRSAYGIHRKGYLGLGEVAVWIGVSSPHRQEAFDACRYIIDEVKVRLPVWKKEHYSDGPSEWVNCQRCQEASHL